MVNFILYPKAGHDLATFEGDSWIKHIIYSESIFVFQSKVSIIASVCSLLVVVVLVAMQLSISTSISSSVSSNLDAYSSDSGYFGGKSNKNGPVLDPTRIEAPKGGTGELGEFIITDEVFPPTEIIIDDGTKDIDFAPKVTEEVAPVLAEDAGFIEKITFYLGVIWAWILGDRNKDNGYEMSCKPKKGGGKVCIIDRG
ncbi:hypothetical protein EDD53_1657 [Pacificibacter maritimus]|uniref:Uncharacterized protein n=1 Tax=Pacificibacter maritimus TaxID=762213 RepID=A0A3N4U9W3_9RHOB|nr:hypothetical protein [Pacificibacter maritimus]RPE67252.1 hypothetical protein EDD53_1657 [Pacificibacter maritimus]